MISSILQYANNVIEFLAVNSLYALVLACLVFLIRTLFRFLPERVEYGLWCLVLIRLILPVDLSFEYSVSGIAKDWFMAAQQTHLSTTISTFQYWSSLPAIFHFNEITFSSVDLVCILWFSIVAVVLLRYIKLKIRLLRILNRAQPIVDYTTVNCVNRWRLKFWIKQKVHVIAEDHYLSPFTCFWKTPIIFIPVKILQTRDPLLIESILAHEMAHVKRYDALWLAFQNIIQMIYFFNPLVWFVVHRLSVLRETLCDEMVLSANCLKPRDYGNSLLSVLRFNISGEIRERLVNTFLGYKGEIKRRISNIASFVPKAIHPLFDLSIVVIFAVLFLPFTKPMTDDFHVIEKSAVESVVESPFPEEVARQLKLPILKHRKTNSL